MKLRLTRERVFQIWYVLHNLKVPEGEKLDRRFDFARNRTMDNIGPEVAEIVKARQSGVSRYDEFVNKRNDILSQYANKDADGNPIVNGNQYAIDSDKMNEASQKIHDLVNDYKDALEERQKEIDIYNEIVGEEIEVDIVQCSFAALPNFVNEEFTKVIRPMIKETDEEIENLL
jgi:hypothetical protein